MTPDSLNKVRRFCRISMHVFYVLVATFVLFGCGRLGDTASSGRNPNSILCTMEARASVGVVLTFSQTETSESLNGLTISIRDGEFLKEYAWNSTQSGSFHDGFGGFDESKQVFTWGGIYERPGNYQITISHPHYSTEVRALIATEDGCHVKSDRLSITLQ